MTHRLTKSWRPLPSKEVVGATDLTPIHIYGSIIVTYPYLTYRYLPILYQEPKDLQLEWWYSFIATTVFLSRGHSTQSRPSDLSGTVRTSTLSNLTDGRVFTLGVPCVVWTRCVRQDRRVTKVLSLKRPNPLNM